MSARAVKIIKGDTTLTVNGSQAYLDIFEGQPFFPSRYRTSHKICIAGGPVL